MQPLPSDLSLQVATQPHELPAHIAKQLGPMFLRRYSPSLVPPAHRGFKDGTWKGCLVWALAADGEVCGWALRAIPPGKQLAEVMTFVKAKYRRQGLGDRMLDVSRQWGPKVGVVLYPHSPEATAFYAYRAEKLSGNPKTKRIA